jgi:ribosomal protein S18 acetylase RimI-like enzyme
MNKYIYQTTTKTGKTVSFRYPTKDDIQIITDFINKASKEKTFIRFQGEELSLEDEKKWLETTLKKIENKEKIFLMAFIDNKYVGSSDVDLGVLTRKHVGTFGIIIDHDFRGEGVGKILMNLVISESKKKLTGLKMIILEVFASNYIAQGLYKKMGFVEYGRLPKASKRRGKYVDEILMYKKI